MQENPISTRPSLRYAGYIFMMLSFLIFSSTNILAQAHIEHEDEIDLASYRAGYANKVSPSEALQKLKDGNDNFANNNRHTIEVDLERLKQFARSDQSEYAFASILSCSDSRVPLELIFDQDFLDLFVVRIAGNVAGVTQLGSLEFAVGHLYTPVLVVLGHEECGAIDATILANQQPDTQFQKHLPALVEHIDPAVDRVKQQYPEARGDELLHLAIEENVYQQIAEIFFLSPITRTLAKENIIQVVGAVYDLETGRVRWLPSDRVDQILQTVSEDPNRIKNIYAIPEEPGVSEQDVPQMDMHGHSHSHHHHSHHTHHHDSPMSNIYQRSGDHVHRVPRTPEANTNEAAANNDAVKPEADLNLSVNIDGSAEDAITPSLALTPGANNASSSQYTPITTKTVILITLPFAILAAIILWATIHRINTKKHAHH